MKKLYKVKPLLKACEFGPVENGGAFISFQEYVQIPGPEKADISIRFERNNSFEEVQELVKLLKARGFTFAVEK
jgi:hypothetical protein